MVPTSSTPSRRALLTGIGAGLATALAGCLSQSQPSGDLGDVADAWPMAGQNASHMRQVDAGPTDPDPVWEVELDAARSTGTPVLAGGRLYAPVDAISEIARHRYRLHALSAATGNERWQVPLRTEPNGPPAVSGDHVVVTAKRALEQGRIVGFETQYGAEDWLVDIDARLTAPPTIANGVVYAPDWRGRVHALLLADGTELWSRDVDIDGGRGTFANAVAVRDGTAYVGSQSGATGLVALDTQTGDVQWTASTPAITGGPVVHSNGIVVQSHQLVIAFDHEGTRKWTFNVREDTQRPLAVDDQHVYAATQDALYAIDWTGEKAWVREATGAQFGAPTVAGDSVLVRGNGQLIARSCSTGDERWTTNTSGRGRMIVAPAAVFLADSATVTALGNPE
jgi:outer membrane protein assembly factor BamB